jgi:rRNA maturation endonuclease Nob1
MPSFLLVFFTAFMMALLGVAIVRKNQLKFQRQRQMRKELKQRIETLPILKVTEALGISFAKFFYATPVKQMHESVQRCEACSATEQCESKLSKPELSLSELHFCPVKDCLGKHDNPNAS